MLDPPPAKKARTPLFDHYSTSQAPGANEHQQERQLTNYLEFINSATFNSAENTMAFISQRSDFSGLQSLFERVLCAPASSAPVERIFSQSGLIVRPHRAKISDKLLEGIVYLKCNAKLGF
jgi:hypothetical protein